MDCVLLGSGGMMPMPYRFLTSLAIRFKGHLYMFDAGEGTQISLKKVKLGIKHLRVLAISHLHGDHCLGIPGLLMMKAQVKDPPPLTIIGPPGIESFVSEIHEHLGFFINFPITFIEWSETASELAYQDELAQILWAPLKHTIFCLGYLFEEKSRPGKFKPVVARALGIPEGPLWGSLQRGENVTLEDGRQILPNQVSGKTRNGRHVCYAVDTRPNKALYRLSKNTDIAFLDGMFLPKHREEAETRGHMTADDAARVAYRANIHKAVLVHISPRYGLDETNELAEAAAKRYERAEIGRDHQWYDIVYRDE